MKIDRLKIRNFRSITKIDLKCEDILVLCGANSAGKSNVLSAIELSFRENYVAEDAIDFIPRQASGPRILVHVDVYFSNVPAEVREISPSTNDVYIYSFRLSRKGNVTKRLNNKLLDSEELATIARNFSVTYVPAIRDLEANEKNPIQELIERQIYSGATYSRITSSLGEIRREVKQKADSILAAQQDVAKTILGVTSLGVSTDQIDLPDLHKLLDLSVTENTERYALQQMGSGHQNIALIGLFRQLSMTQPGHSLLLIEEPDAHLHPPIIRAMADELLKTSQQAQVFLTSHSGTLINHLGLNHAQHVYLDAQDGTRLVKNEFAVESKHNNLLLRHGIRIAEALFSKLVILVEGVSDATLLDCLVLRRLGRTLNSMDVLLVPINGKAEIPIIASIIDSLGISWVAILDFDATYNSTTIPLVDEEEVSSLTSSAAISEHLQKIDEIALYLATDTKRGRKAKLMFDAVKDEIENGVPQLAYLENSVVHTLIDSIYEVSESRIIQLERDLRFNRKRAYRSTLKQYNVIILNPDLEGAITAKQGNSAIVESVLRNEGIISAAVPTPCSNSFIASKLHGLGSNSVVWEAVINKLEDVNGFSRTEINSCYKILKEDYLQALGIVD